MDKPGLQRAIPYMIVVFIASLILVYAVRSVQNMDPVWGEEGAQTGLVLAAFASMGAFMWGIGAFDPKMSEHGDHGDEAHETVAPEADFTLRTDGWFYYLGYIQHQFGMAILNGEPFYPSFELPPISNGLVNIIAHILWIPLFATLFVVGAIAKALVAIKNIPYKWFDFGFFLINWIINLALLPIWIIGAIVVRLLLAGLAIAFIVQGIMVMALAWALQLVRFYLGDVLMIATISIVLIIALFAFALLPTGLRLETSNEPNASFAQNGFGDFTIPIADILGLVVPDDNLSNQVIPETSQFAVLLGFIVIIFVSLAIFAGLIALFFYLMNRGMKEVQEIPATDADKTPPLPVREIGGVANAVTRFIRIIPEAIGYKK